MVSKYQSRLRTGQNWPVNTYKVVHFNAGKYARLMAQERQSEQMKKVLSVLRRCSGSKERKRGMVQKVVAPCGQQRVSRQKDSLQNYRQYEVIGKGAFGEVRLAQCLRTGAAVVIKRMSKDRLACRKQIAGAYVEKELLMRSTHPCIVQLYSTFQDETYLYIVMEYVPGGDLLRLLIQKNLFTQQETQFYIGELVLGVEKIHQMKFIHRDIKPDNLLIGSDGHLKISDFGLSKLMQNCVQHHKTYSKVGTPDYISPEILTEDSYDEMVDIWSIGVIMFECMFGYPPFSDDDSTEVCRKVINWETHLKFPEDVVVSAAVYDLILGLLSHRKDRLSLAAIKQHPFFQGFSWEKVQERRPPFIPVLEGELDTKYFQCSLQEEWTNDIAIRRSLSAKVLRFPGFQYRKLNQCRKQTQCSININNFNTTLFKKKKKNILKPFQSVSNIFKKKIPKSMKQNRNNSLFRKRKLKK